MSLEDFVFCWLLVGKFLEFCVGDGLRPSDPKAPGITELMQGPVGLA